MIFLKAEKNLTICQSPYPSLLHSMQQRNDEPSEWRGLAVANVIQGEGRDACESPEGNRVRALIGR